MHNDTITWRRISPPPLLAGTPKPGFGRKLFPKAHFEPTGLVFPEEGKKNPERGFTGGVTPPGFPERRKDFSRQGVTSGGVEPPNQIRNLETFFCENKENIFP